MSQEDLRKNAYIPGLFLVRSGDEPCKNLDLP
jgi:hypothetical protein